MNGDNVDHARVYYEAVGGRDRRGRVFGLAPTRMFVIRMRPPPPRLWLVGLRQILMRSLSYAVRSVY